MTTRNREPKPVWTPDGFPSIGDWKRPANDRLSTTVLEFHTPDHRMIRLFYSYKTPIAFTEWNDGVRTAFVWWTPGKTSVYRTLTLMKHLKLVKALEILVDGTPKKLKLRDCGDHLHTFQLLLEVAKKDPLTSIYMEG